MKTAAVGAVCGNIFMTVETQAVLLGAIEGLMACLALHLGLCVTLDHVTGHHQRLNGLGRNRVACEACNHHYQSR